MKAFLTLVLLLSHFIAAFAQSLAAPTLPPVSLFASAGYTGIKDMSNLRFAFYDARHTRQDEALFFFRRYIDDIQNVHPSVLVNRHGPSHLITLASNLEELEEASKLITSNRRQKSIVVILAYSGNISDLTNADLKSYTAVYALSDAELGSKYSAVDILSQAVFSGLEIAMPNILSLDNGRLVGMSMSKTRLGYASPETVGMSSEILSGIDDIARKMISEEASPGCYILVARHGMVVWSKPYGNSMYRGGQEVTWSDLYDIASVSKAFGTLPVVMRMFDEGKLSANTTLGSLLPEVDSAKVDIPVADLLQHQSGLAAGVATYLMCVDSTSFKQPLYSYRRKSGYTMQVESRLYMNNDAHVKLDLFSPIMSEQYPVQVSSQAYTTDSMRMAVLSYIDNSKLLRKTYRYSDLNFIYLQQIIERIYQLPLNQLFNGFIARPLGIRRMLYRPMERYSLSEIIPTENDRYFRGEQVWGTVHDQTAALLGGVAGNAGLFANANEIAKVAQMYLWHGSYGGMQIIKASTVDDFTKRHATGNRRGYGFDKPDINGGGPVCDQASQSSYGHSGFSGTLVWVDPQSDMIYIFLSNRICPNAYNNKLTTTSVRSNVHEVVYKSIIQ